MRKQRNLQARMLLSKNGGLAPAVEKCEFPREKRDRYGFTPLKRPGFLLKQSQTMRSHAENTRIRSETTHKPTIAEPVFTRGNPPGISRPITEMRLAGKGNRRPTGVGGTSMKPIQLTALALALAAASESAATAASPPPEKSTLFKKLFGPSKPRPNGPTVRTPGRPLIISAPLPAEQLAEALRAEQDAYLRRVSVCTELRRVALERGDDAMVRQADDLERQFGALYSARVAALGVTRARAPLPEPSSMGESIAARSAANRLLAPGEPVPGTTTAQVREVQP